MVLSILFFLNVTQPREYQAQGKMVFKQLTEAIGQKLMVPIDMEQRIEVIKSGPVMDEIINRLKKRNINISKELGNNLLKIDKINDWSLSLKVVYTEPETVLQLVNAAIDIYTDYNIDDTKSKLEVQHNSFLKEEESLKNDIKTVQGEITTLMEEVFKNKGIVDPDIQSGILSSVLVDFEKQRQQILLDIRELDYRIKNAPQSYNQKLIEYILSKNLSISLLPGPQSEKLKKLLDQLADLRQKYQEIHPDIIKLKDQIVALQNEIQSGPLAEKEIITQEITERRIIFQAKAEFLLEMLTNVYSKLLELSQGKELLQEKRTKLDNLNKRYYAVIDSRKEAERHIAMKKEEMTRMIASTKADQATQIIRAKTVPNSIMIIIAIIISLVACFTMEYLQSTLRTTQDIRNYLGIPTIGGMPKIPHEVSLLKQTVKSPISELFSRIAVFISSSAMEKRAKTVLITSAKAGEGKSTLTANIGISLALSGERVIIIDSDLRHGQQHIIFGLDNSKGFANIVQGELVAEKKLNEALGVSDKDTLHGYLQPTSVQNLSVICSGPVPVNPINLLKSDLAKNTINELKGIADIILLDTPPLLGVIDAAVMAAYIDLAVIVIEEGTLKRQEAAYMKHAMKQTGANMLGAIINKAKFQMDETYYYYYYYYRYRGYGNK